MLVEKDNIEVLSHFNSWQEIMDYAKANYLVDLEEAMGKDEFAFPNFRNLLFIDMRLRNSKNQQTRIHLRDITKIFERGDGGRKGWLGRR